MKHFSSFIILMLFSASTFSQQKSGPPLPQQVSPAGNTYAVIVGISQYENAGIDPLDYAHRDAEVFADYLKSKPGGAVPGQNIVLLTNEKATEAAIYDALYWLVETCQKDDLVYFYFSGHGDLENVTVSKDGFLLPYNSPRTNYMYNAVRIEDLNKIANTLSARNNGKVILITDACHSGKLAGNDSRGNFLAAEQLRKVKANEIRITSCDIDQLSNEDEGWGDGRGVFSYYFVMGLNGAAERNRDGFITKNEMRLYLDSAFAKDPLLAKKVNKQKAVLRGDDNFRLAAVDTSLAFAVQMVAASRDSEDDAAMAPVPKPPQAYFFEVMEKSKPEDVFDFKELNKLAKAELPFAFIKMLPDNSKESIGLENLNALERQLKESPYALQRFSDKLVVMLSDRGQQIINLYLEGDEAELERRRYYNSNSKGYDVYPYMFAVALKLTRPDDVIYRKLEIKQHYFTGVAARLRIPLTEDPKPLIEAALAAQLKAYALNENTAFVNNELGILYKAKKDFVTAEKYFLRATQIADKWAVPWSNLINLYANTKEYTKGVAAYETALKLQANFQGTYVNAGMLYEKQNNFLYAEELFRKSIKMNTRHYLPFERLGHVYMNTTQYDVADSFFNEADIRKRGYKFLRPDSDGDGVVDAFDQVMSPSICYVDRADAIMSGAIGYFVIAMDLYTRKQLGEAEEMFKMAISLDKSNPLAFHYLGKIMYSQRRYKEADIFLNFAVKYFLEPDELKHYVDSVSKKIPESKSKHCIVINFENAWYGRIDNYYFLAGLYKRWNHFAEAEQAYRTYISMNPESVEGYNLLWNMLESIGRFPDAEQVILSYAAINKTLGDKELNAFNKRMISRYPEDGNMYYKAGLFLYHLAANAPDSYSDDRIKAVDDPDINQVKTEQEAGRFVDMIDNSKDETGLLSLTENIAYAENIEYPRTEGIAYFLKADSLLQQDINALADINYKAADLYVWLGVPEKASPYYKRSVDLQPENAGTRLKLIDTYVTTYYFKGALEQLDSLNNRREINFDKQLLLAKFCIHFGRYTDAEPLLKEAQQIHPYKIPETTDLLGRMHFMSNNPKLAIPYYQQYLTLRPNDHLTMYSIASLYARIGNQGEAFKWLEMAMSKGFRYGWVLKFDATWNNYRKLGKWAELQRKFPSKKYTG